jgi:hypothetical protein
MRAEPTLSTVLGLEQAEAAAALQAQPQRYIAQLKGASPEESQQVADLLESMWPSDGIRANITRNGDQFNIDRRVYTILELGPAVNLRLDAERWAEVATCGFTFSEQAGWLREQYSEEGAELAARAEATDVRSWEQVVSAIPSDTPVPEAVVGAIVEKMRTVQRDDDLMFLPYIGRRLVESGQIDALRALIAVDERFATALQPTLAAAGDTEATRGLLERLQNDLAAGRSTHHLELEWLAGAHDPQLLAPLFACLSAALSRPAEDPFGALPSLSSAIRRIGGVEAVRRYDDLIASSEESRFKFMASVRDDVAQDALRRAGQTSASSAAGALGLPYVAKPAE